MPSRSLLPVLQGTSAAAAFTPSSVTGLVAWYDFSDAAKLYTDAGTTPVSADGDLIYQVNDKSGQANHAVQATSGSRPTYRTGVQASNSVARFVDQQLAVPNAFGALTAATVVFVSKNVNDPGSVADSAHHCGAPIAKFGSSGQLENYPYTDGHLYYAFGSSVRKDAGDPTPSLASWRINAVVSAASDWRLYLDGGAVVFSTATNTVAWSTAPALGGVAPNANWPGDIGEVLLYNSALSNANIDAIGGYLATKWGQTWTSAS